MKELGREQAAHRCVRFRRADAELEAKRCERGSIDCLVRGCRRDRAEFEDDEHVLRLEAFHGRHCSIRDSRIANIECRPRGTGAADGRKLTWTEEAEANRRAGDGDSEPKTEALIRILPSHASWGYDRYELDPAGGFFSEAELGRANRELRCPGWIDAAGGEANNYLCFDRNERLFLVFYHQDDIGAFKEEIDKLLAGNGSPVSLSELLTRTLERTRAAAAMLYGDGADE